jgi:hypothetical protein
MKRLPAVLIVVLPLSAAGAIRFDAAQSFRTNTAATRTAIADFNGDGAPDLAVGSPAATTVLLGRGDGTFAEPGNDVPHGATTITPISADVDGDGTMDLVTMANGSLVISAGKGDGTFDTGTISSLAPSNDPVDAAAADFDGDGRLDLAITFGSHGGVAIAHNDGGRHFNATQLDTGFIGTAIRAADLNHDGKPDLVVGARDTSALFIFLNDGAGGFGAPARYGTVSTVFDIVVLDMNRDGKLDLIAATDTHRGFTFDNASNLFMGHGDGSFDPGLIVQLPGPLSPSPSFEQSLVTADFNHDQKADLVSRLTLHSDSMASVYLGAGPIWFDVGGQFIARGPLAAADLDRDGNLDLIVADPSNAREVSVLMGKGDGTFVAPSVLNVTSFNSSTPVLCADFDGDGRQDFFDNVNGTWLFMKGNGNGTFTRVSPAPMQLGGTDTVAVDLNGDGKLDLASLGSDDLVLTQINGSPAIDRTSSIQRTSAFTVGDVDGDGRPDLVVASSSNRQAAFMHNQDGRSFAPRVPIPGNGHAPTNVVIRDVNGDGRGDMIFGLADFGFEVHLQLASGSPGPPFVYESFAGGFALVDDFDLDGRPDVIVAGGGNLAFSSGRGNGTFRAAQLIDMVSKGPVSLTSADIDGDGLRDLLVTDTANTDLSIYRGHGDGTFGAPIRFALGTSAAIAVADFTSDGRPDILTHIDHSTALLVNRSTAESSPTGVWSGSSDAAWSHGANWLGGTAPVAPQSLVFPANTNNQTMTNDFPPGTRFASIALSGFYTVGGNDLELGQIRVRGGQTTMNTALRLRDARLIVDEGAALSLRSATRLDGDLTIAAPSGAPALVTFAGPVTGSGNIHVEPAATLVLLDRVNAGGVDLLGTLHVAISAADSAPGLSVAGNVTVGGTLRVTALPLAAGTTITIIDNDGIEPINGTFVKLPEGAVIRSLGSVVQDFRISYAGGTGNDVTLTAVGPPATQHRRSAGH